MNAKKIMKNLAGLSTGLAVTVAFFNVALLITELVKTVTDDGRELGTVKDVMETGANDVYIISKKDSPKSELLLPATKEVILEINPEEGIMRVHLLPGLED